MVGALVAIPIGIAITAKADDMWNGGGVQFFGMAIGAIVGAVVSEEKDRTPPSPAVVIPFTIHW